MNRLFYGDCFTIMHEWPLEYVDLIYLDPPFKSDRNYNAIYKDETGMPLPDQVEAFCDMWELDAARIKAIHQMPILLRENGIDDKTAEFWRLWMNALRDTQPHLLAYLSYMVERLLVMKNILKPTGSIYLHCDPTAGHYIKVMMDGIFGHDNFMNEIVWKRYAVHSLARKGFDTVSDLLFVYAKDINQVVFNNVYGDFDEAELEKKFKHIEKETGRRFQHIALEQSSNNSSAGEERIFGDKRFVSDIGWRWSQKYLDEKLENNPHLIYWTKNGKPRYKDYADEYKGVPLGNIWTDIKYLSSNDSERLYITQKPVALLKRIIQASSQPGDLVLDPFCGCATTIEAAHKLGRKWIGIDIAIHAIKRVASVRLENRMGLKQGDDFIIEGVPRNLEGARDLWERDKYHFQKWAVEQVNGFVTSKKTSDGGIDGRLYFRQDWNSKELDSMILEVKGGMHVSIGDVRALKGVLDNDNALMAGLIVMNKPSNRQLVNFRNFMARAGVLTVNGHDYPKMQLLSVEEIFEGKRFITPFVVGKSDNQPRTITGWETVQAHNL